jgi:hypothetical protein
VLDYGDNGAVLKKYLMQEKGQKHWSRRIASADYYGRSGLTYPERTTSDFSSRPLPENSIFSHTGLGIFLSTRDALLKYMGLSYSRIFKQLIELYVGSGDASESGSAARHYTSGILNEMKVPQLGGENSSHIPVLVSEAVRLRQREFQRIEETLHFVAPAVLHSEKCDTISRAVEESTSEYKQYSTTVRDRETRGYVGVQIIRIE